MLVGKKYICNLIFICLYFTLYDTYMDKACLQSASLSISYHAHVLMLKLRIWVTHQILNFETRVLQYLQIVEHWNVNITYLYIEDSMWKNNMRLIFFNQVRLHSYIYYNQYHKYLPALEWVAVFHQSTYGPRLPK